MNVFKYDSELMLFIGRLADLAWLSVLCFICSLPIVTMGASVTAKYYTAMKLEKGEASSITKTFFHSFKENFKQSIVLTIILDIIAVFFVADWILVLRSGSAMSAIFIGLLAIFSAMYAIISFCIFPLLSRFEMKTKDAFVNALVFGIVHLPRIIFGVVMALAPYVISYWYFKWGWLIWLGINTFMLYYNARYFMKKFDTVEEMTFGKKITNPDLDEEEELPEILKDVILDKPESGYNNSSEEDEEGSSSEEDEEESSSEENEEESSSEEDEEESSSE